MTNLLESNFDYQNAQSLAVTAGRMAATADRVDKLHKAADEHLGKLNDVLERAVTSQEEAVRSQDSLSRKLLWLNCVLAFATLVGAIATGVLAYPVITGTPQAPPQSPITYEATTGETERD